MSLSRILNDEPSPAPSARSSYTTPSRNILFDPVHLNPSPAAVSDSPPHSRSLPHHSRSESYSDAPPPTRSYNYRTPHYEAGRWDAYSGQWAHDEHQGSPHNIPERDRDSRRSRSPDGPYQRTPTFDDQEGSGPRKRRKGDVDTDYQPPGQKRHSSRKSQSHSRKQIPPDTIVHRDSPVRHFLPDEEGVPRPTIHATEEDRLASSDLEDCEEIWLGDLGEYVLETQKRIKQVESWFNESMKERTSITAQRMSHYYSSKIANIPVLPPSPPLLAPQVPDEEPLGNGYEYPDSNGYGSIQLGNNEADIAPEFEDAPLASPQARVSAPRRGKGEGSSKRPAADAVSDGNSDADIPLRKGKAPAKRRRVDTGIEDISMSVDPSGLGPPGISDVVLAQESVSARSSKGKGKQVQQTDDTSISKVSRRKPGPKKKPVIPVEMDPMIVSLPPSIAGDMTPSVSRPTSPVPTITSVVFELDEEVAPLKKAKRMDDAAMLKRVKTLEEAQRKVWTNIARRDVAKVYKYHALGYQARVQQSERIAKLASIQARRPFSKTAKATKETQAKAKRLMREMQVFWKKNEREERDVRKREHKEAMDRLKMEEEKREASRQARKLEFLISQTELYSHFVGNKLKTAEVEGDAEGLPVPAGADVTDDPDAMRDIDFDDDDQANLYRHARHNAQEAIALAKQKAEQFDTQAALERKTNEAIKLAKAQSHVRDDDEGGPSGSKEGSTSGGQLMDLDSDELNFQNPTSLSGQLTIKQPKMLMAQLKEYQLKGLNWLATLYEQGINGILADEMGLGKTVQSISLLSYLAETHDIWGPFLVVAPASTLHNWQQEITRFVPGLKALPYWGNVKDRATLRKFWSKKEISYNKDAPFHILITSYQLVTQDQQYFQRIKWQYMILDEAQNIKNSSSVRWKTLLGFQCRNRLLLTGTPIQNSMQELWALLHFIMPSLFDSHDEFNEWFSKDIENAAENKGGKLNEHQLRRLHMILKPFMLRRVKRHVQNELSEKIEKDIYVDLSARQRAMYKTLRAKVSVADLLAKAANIGDADSARSLMNLVMQFRKVCNHPELFERADVVAPFSFCHFGRSGPISREGDSVSLSYSTRNPIEVAIPELMYEDGGLVDVPHSGRDAPVDCLSKLMNIWSTDWIHRSIYESDVSSSFAFLRLLDMSPQEAHSLHRSPLISRQLVAIHEDAIMREEAPYRLDPTFSANFSIAPAQLSVPPRLLSSDAAEGLPDLRDASVSAWSQSCLSRPELRWYVPPVVAAPISMYCRNRSFVESQTRLQDAPLESLALYGVPSSLRDSGEACDSYQRLLPGLSPLGLLATSPSHQLPMSTMQVPEAKRLIYDSAKLARLDTLLQELKTGDHRVLVYFQMTRMMDLMEEYLIYRQYKYLRLDGSSKLEDRRDMVIDWQTRPDIFVFLLSTRAGGLGINLTAADTVIFYDHDWNPSNDAQAMDRAHRLGQTRQVTVYRLITKGTIDERIVQLASVKKDVQDIVVGNKSLTDVAKPSEIVQLLLNDEQLANLDTSATSALSTNDAAGKPGNGDGPERDLWNDEGDDFFGHSGPAQGPVNPPPEPIEDENRAPNLGESTRGKKRKAGRGGRKSTGRKKAGTTTENAPIDGDRA